MLCIYLVYLNYLAHFVVVFWYALLQYIRNNNLTIIFTIAATSRILFHRSAFNSSTTYSYITRAILSYNRPSYHVLNLVKHLLKMTAKSLNKPRFIGGVSLDFKQRIRE